MNLCSSLTSMQRNINKSRKQFNSLAVLLFAGNSFCLFAPFLVSLFGVTMFLRGVVELEGIVKHLSKASTQGMRHDSEADALQLAQFFRKKHSQKEL